MNGQFRACAQALQANFPGLKIEGESLMPLMSNGVRTRSANAAVTVDRPASSPFQELLIASRDHPPSDLPAGSDTDQM